VLGTLVHHLEETPGAYRALAWADTDSNGTNSQISGSASRASRAGRRETEAEDPLLSETREALNCLVPERCTRQGAWTLGVGAPRCALGPPCVTVTATVTATVTITVTATVTATVTGTVTGTATGTATVTVTVTGTVTATPALALFPGLQLRPVGPGCTGERALWFVAEAARWAVAGDVIAQGPVSLYESQRGRGVTLYAAQLGEVVPLYEFPTEQGASLWGVTCQGFARFGNGVLRDSSFYEEQV